jgi:hypothetical protein
MKYLHEKPFEKLSPNEKDSILEFFSNLTEGDIFKIGCEMLMDKSDIREVCQALEKFQQG